MPRTARLVVPGLPHHIVQRGNRQQDIFFSDDDRRAFLDILAVALEKHRTRCLAWCLMSNHFHLILVPRCEDDLRASMTSLQTTYAQRINRNQGTSGHLFQGRYASYVMDDAHMMVAARYIENNPVAARTVPNAEDWPWSSARAHISGQSDGITDVGAIGRHVANWRAMLAEGLEAADKIDVSLRSGRPLGGPVWLNALTEEHGVNVRVPRQRGRPKTQLPPAK